MDMLAPLLTYSAALAIAAVIPGPGVAALVGQSLGGNLRSAFAFLAGLALGDVTYLCVAVAGLAAISKLFAGVFIVIKCLSGLYLLYIAYTFWTSRAGLSDVRATRERTGVRAFFAGYTITLSNSKTVVFYLALLPSVLDLGRVGSIEWVALSILTVLILFAVLTPYAVLANRARAMMSRLAALMRLNRAAAGIIGLAGGVILLEAVAHMFRRV
jgi:threonine/homoserine/homoserine lactone efflux protein